MKKIVLHILFSLFFIANAFAQKQPFNPLPLATTTVTCISGTYTLTLVISGTDPKCFSSNDGSVCVAASGGIPPYSYSWNLGAYATACVTGLTGNSYLIEVWDSKSPIQNYCSGSIAISNPTILGVNITPPAPVTSCYGLCNGEATASGTGGTPPYTYSWNTFPVQTTALATGLCSQTYTVTITDNNGCIRTKTVFIDQPALLAANGSSTTINCFDACNGSASAAPTGGNPPYTYSWMPGGAATSAIGPLCPGTFTCTVTDTKTCIATYTASITQPTALSVTVTGTNLVCNAVCTGSVTATVSGGTSPYSYLWSPGGCTTSACTGLCAGTYSLTVTDGNGCIKTGTVALTQPGAMNVAPTGVNISCFNQCDGTVNANAGGGTFPYAYSWAPGGCTTSSCSNLCIGTYTVNVNDASGCAIAGTVTLTQPALLTVAPTKTDVTCSNLCNGNVTATAAGGTSPYTYAWTPGGCTTSACAGLCVGTYSITVTDSKGCTATRSVTITSPPLLSANLSSTPASCFGVCDGSISSSASGGTAPYTYNWSNGCTTTTCSGLCIGTYTLTVQDANGCIATKTVSVSQPNAFTASISSATPNPLNCNGDCNGTAAVTVNGGTPTYMYQWSTGSTTPSVTGLCSGVYNVSVTDLNGCVASTSVTFSQPTTLSVTISSSNPTCSGGCNGSISAIASGGTPGYTFSWLPGGQTTSTISSQCVGNYTLATTDSKGCSNTQTVTLTTAFPLAANASVVKNASCSGSCDGAVTANPTGGSFPFTYLWAGGSTSQTVTGLCAGTFSVMVTDASGCTNIDIVAITQPSILSSSISSTTSSCTLCTGKATVTTSGGTFPYTFLWTPSGQTSSAAVGLCIGTYVVDVTDANGCTNSLSTVINPLVTIALTVSGTSVSCSGACNGITTATPFGGGSPYTYQWSTTPVQTTQSATGLCAGNYSVAVSDVNGCVSTNTVTFTSPPPLASTMSATVASCGVCNGTATAAPSGGTGTYTYSWSGFPIQTTATATGLCSGNYSVTIADANNCTTTNTVSVGNISAISDNPSVTLAACGANDGAVCVSPSGGTPGYTYVWSPGNATTSCITGLAAGIYTVLISDAAGCSNTFAIAVGNTNEPVISVLTSVNPTCNGDCNGSISVSASLGTAPYTFLWSPGGQTTTAVSALCAGTYIVQAEDAVPCTAFATIVITDPPQMSATPVITNVTCSGGNNGSICISPSGGTSPYTFTWSNGQITSCATGLIAGTYTVILTDAAGCDDTIAIPVTEPAILDVTISATDVTCNGNANGTATATVTGGTMLYTYAWNTGVPIPSVVGLSPGTYSVIVTDNKGCAATASVVISQPAALTTTVTFTNITCNSLCDGTADLAVAGGTVAYTYAWSPGGETTAAITGLCTGNYAGTITDANGCSSTKTVSITQPSTISAAVTLTNASCFGGCNGAASASVSGGTGAYTYSWGPGGQTTTSVTELCAGSYTLVTSDANGCNAINLFSITAPTVLQANITKTPPSCTFSCDGTATSAPIGGTGTGTYTYQWNNGQTNATATGLCAGTYTLTLFDANGCFITQTINIVAPLPITITWGTAGTTCLICNGSITVIASGGAGSYLYTWASGETTATIAGLCAGLYPVTVTDGNGCTGDDTIPVNNVTGPSFVTTGTNITCFGACNGITTISSVTGEGPPWLYSWFPSNQTTLSATGLCPNQYFAAVTDTNGCKTINPINLAEPPELMPNPAVTNSSCLGICNGGITLSPTGGTGAYTYNWMPGALTAQNISSQCAGNYTLTLTDTDGCALSTTVTIGQITILTSSVTSTNAICGGSCDGAATVAVAGGNIPYTYLWNPTAAITAAASGLCAGTHTITVTDANGCIQIDSAIITLPVVLASNITGINPLCNTSCNGIVSASPAGGTLPYTYSWNASATTSSVTGLCAGSYTLLLSDANNCSATSTVTLTDPPAIASTDVVIHASCANTSDGSINITPAGGTGVYTFIWNPSNQTTEDATGLTAGIYSVTITDGNGCSLTDSMTVNATTLVIAAAGNDTFLCAAVTATFCSGSINAASVAWYQLPGWILVGNTNCVNISLVSGNTSYGLIAMNGTCSDTDSVVVTINTTPFVNAGSNVTIFATESTVLNGSGTGTYVWSPATGLSSTTIANPIASPTLTTIYTLIVTEANGCTAADSVTVTIIPPVIANDGLSPNGDGINDEWVIAGIEWFPDVLIEIYNRWGELLFHSIGYKERWNCTYKGKDLPIGTYYYIINLNSDKYPDPITGPITILR